ncbi:hypothetical protein ACFLZO_00625 [Patescibacteria group bacterium]
MTQEEIKPKKIDDIVYRIDEYLSVMREMEDDQVVDFIGSLENYIREYFADQKHDELELKKQLVQLVDALYVITMKFGLRDIHTDGYFGIVLNRLFWGYQQRNICAFFVLDNSLRDDRFKMVVELFRSAGFGVVAPYILSDLEYSDNNTALPTLELNGVEKQIVERKAEKKHILYVEKDATVNYLHEVLTMAEEFQSEYVCIFRNQAPDGDSAATWLMGAFSDRFK